MKTEKIKEIINQYFDQELSKSEEVILFTQLSKDMEARDYFKQMNSLRNILDSSMEEYPEKLDERIYSGISSRKEITILAMNRSRIYSAVSYALAVILLAVSIFFYNQSLKSEERIEIAYEQLKHQNKMIQALFNTLPQAEVNAEFANEIIVTPKM
jgi:hypothetical protein